MLELGTEVLDKTFHWQGCGVTECADGAPGNVICNRYKRIEIVQLTFPVLDPANHSV